MSYKWTKGDEVKADRLNETGFGLNVISQIDVNGDPDPDLTLRVKSGLAIPDGITVKYMGGNTPSFVAPITNDRIDVVSIDTSGDINITQGVEDPSPVAPAYPGGEIALVEVYCRPGMTKILNNDTDPAEGYISFDARPIGSGSSLIDETTGPTDAGKGTKTDANGLLHKSFLRKLAASLSNAATPAINTDTYERIRFLDIDRDITSLTTNLTGSPQDGDRLAIRFRNQQSRGTTFVNATANQRGSASSVVINIPASVADGDIMFASLMQGGGYVNSVPSGWTLVAQLQNGAYFDLYYKIAGPSEPSSYTFGWAGSSSYAATIVAYRGGFNKQNPIGTISNTLYNTSNTVMQAASLTPARPDATLLYFAGWYNTSGGSAVSIGAVSQGGAFAWDNDSPGTAGSPRTLWAVSKMQGRQVGATGVIESSYSGSSQTTNKHAFALVLNPVDFNITPGASFKDGVFSVRSGTTVLKEWEYNSAESKWVPLTPTKKQGMETFDTTSANGTITTIPHGLGRAPKRVRITANYKGGSSGDASQSIGSMGEAGDNDCAYFIFTEGSSSAVADVAGRLDDYAILLNHGATLGATGRQYGFVYADDTNIYIRWEKSGSPTGNAFLFWETE